MFFFRIFLKISCTYLDQRKMSAPKQETLNSNDQKAYDNLDEDSKKIIDRLDNLVDKISEPLRNALVEYGGILYFCLVKIIGPTTGFPSLLYAKIANPRN